MFKPDVSFSDSSSFYVNSIILLAGIGTAIYNIPSSKIPDRWAYRLLVGGLATKYFSHLSSYFDKSSLKNESGAKVCMASPTSPIG